MARAEALHTVRATVGPHWTQAYLQDPLSREDSARAQTWYTGLDQTAGKMAPATIEAKAETATKRPEKATLTKEKQETATTM